ncbi:hypothetical protein BV22DRAFT_1135896 [Leucogyrophana mollusca]|uniref:Uncharacterized protein n=1 Tax=Leucogyrophana mollusca TaxID=85980 RepID=A0ACB8AUR6_9AGAM|nr:hypothetical protein BV22DRAFT_1135896 [Leucogyrophana mollusca]
MTDEPHPSREFRYALRKPEAVGVRPPHNKALQQCLAAFVEINGFRAYTLFDLGSTTDSVSPQTTRIAKLPYFTLENPVTLQLGCVGSRSQVNYSADVVVGFAGKAADTYVDVVNMDRYDAILGARFMHEHGICLDFKTKSIVMDGRACPALTVGEETAVVNARRGPPRPKKAAK